ncbi:unnamed protein product [Cladocopium goreaui]|uniref:Uncharacterized protein n=1 Tax=Cladocopium goreaui TaxID=2562237 RepID=A0A9P1DR69_9DINO|nr:unnamed protein product [Cladocopium goreaui]
MGKSSGPGIRLTCVPPVKPEVCEDWADTFHSTSWQLCHAKSCQPEEIHFDAHPELEEFVAPKPSILPAERCKPPRNSYLSWTEYEQTDPYAQPNRFSHELSSDMVGMFLKEVEGNPKSLQRFIRKKRGEPEEVGVIGWAKNLFSR